MKCWEPLMIYRVTGKKPCLSSMRKLTVWPSWPGKAAPRSKGCSRAMPSRLAPGQTRSGLRGTMTDGESAHEQIALPVGVVFTIHRDRYCAPQRPRQRCAPGRRRGPAHGDGPRSKFRGENRLQAACQCHGGRALVSAGVCEVEPAGIGKVG